MAVSQNGWPGLASDSALLHKWIVPGTNRYFVLRNGSAGFLLSHFSMWFHEKVERLDLGIWDDWAYAYREIREDTVLSNHASGTAVDLNATKHPLGVPTLSTFTQAQVDRIHRRLRTYRGVLRWGGDYQNRPDAMHVEINKPLRDAERVARRLTETVRGEEILAANPGQKKVIFS